MAYKVGYKNIADISKDRIRRAIKQFEMKALQPNQLGMDLGEDSMGRAILKKNNILNDLGFKVFKLTASNFKIWRSGEVNEENLMQQLEAFTNPVHANSPEQNMLYELMLKAGYQLTDPEMVAEIFPYFKYDRLPDFGRENL